MRQLREPSGPSRPWVLILAGLLLLSATACQSLQDSLYGPSQPPAGDTREEATPVAIGGWTDGRLYCDQGRCERWYEVVLDQPGVLKVDLYAPVGKGYPDCEMRLETRNGEALPARSGRVQSRRQLRYDADAGTYHLKIVARGDNGAPFDYDMNVRLEGGQTIARPTTPVSPSDVPMPKPTPKPTPSPEVPDVPLAESGVQPESEPETSAAVEEEPEAVAIPEPPRAPSPSWVEAEVLDVQEVAGRPQIVMIEAGESEGLSSGMHGVLVEGENEIGEIEIIEVYPSGSRARIVGPLSAPISFDTLSRIQVPPDGE